MTQEDKELLLKDLSARLTYGVFMTNKKLHETFYPLTCEDLNDAMFDDDWDDIPYLRPMSSMTEEEIKELSEIDMKRLIFSSRHLTWHLDGEIIDYLNKKMLDCRGLIPRGLALKAPEDMYK